MTSDLRVNNQGFTLVEILIYLAIIGLVVSVFAQFIFSISSVRNKMRSAQDVERNVRSAVEIVTREIREAREFATTTPANQEENRSEVLVLLDGEGDQIAFYTVNGDLLRFENNTTTRLTASDIDVTNLDFTIVSIASTSFPHIQIDMTATKRNAGSQAFSYEARIQTAAAVRVQKGLH